MEAWLGMLFGYVLIFCARVADMSLDVIRVLLLTRGWKWLASMVGFVEIIIFILVLNYVLQDGLTDPGKIIAYAAGFATGNLVGGIMEERLAMGFVSLQVFPPVTKVDELTALFRREGFGVTLVTGEGRDGYRKILFLFLKRKDLNRALKVLNQYDPKMFFSVSDARIIHGGIIPGRSSVVAGR
jgi:uncharacterized protein YebE (UPF0316 family)